MFDDGHLKEPRQAEITRLSWMRSAAERKRLKAIKDRKDADQTIEAIDARLKELR